MAYTIRFNLICDGYPCRSLDDIREHFSLDDLLDHYKTGLLKRWLKVRKLNYELKEVEAINSTNPQHILEELVRIFELLIDDDSLKEALSIIAYRNNQLQANKINAASGFKSNSIANNYLATYESLVNTMVDKNTPPSALNQHMTSLVNDYSRLLRLSAYELFSTCLLKRPLVLLHLFYNEHTRDIFVPKLSLLSASVSNSSNSWGGMKLLDWDAACKNLKSDSKAEYHKLLGKLSEQLQPVNMPFIFLNTIANSLANKNFAQAYRELFEDQVIIVDDKMIKGSSSSSSYKTLEDERTRCLILPLGTNSINAQLNGQTFTGSSIRPFCISNGLKVSCTSDNQAFAYFKADDNV